jgi:hypothetical protein
MLFKHIGTQDQAISALRKICAGRALARRKESFELDVILGIQAHQPTKAAESSPLIGAVKNLRHCIDI